MTKKYQKKQTTSITEGSYTPSWIHLKTKEEAWKKGYNNGAQDTRASLEQAAKASTETLRLADRQVQLDAIKAMGHSLECMVKALMSMNGQL